MVLRRQEHLACRATAMFAFSPLHTHDEAGLVVRMNESHHYDLLLGLREGQPCVYLRLCIGPAVVVVQHAQVRSASVVLQISATAVLYAFSFDDGDGLVLLGQAPTRYLSTEIAGGWTGVLFGLYASSPASSTAHVDWFDYEPSEPLVQK